MITVLAMILKFLGGGVLNSVLTHLEKQADTETEREKLKTQVTIETIKNVLAQRALDAQVHTEELKYPEIRLFLALAYGGAVFVFFTMIVRWLYFPGTPLAQLDPWTTGLLSLIFSGLLYSKKGT
jgi:hypothetical protein